MLRTIALSLLFGHGALQAQYCSVFDALPGNPDALMTTPELPNPSADYGWAQLLVPGSSTWSAPQNIGFFFQFNGNDYSQYVVSPNGVVSFTLQPNEIPGSAPTALPNPQLIPDNSICVWGMDMSGFNDEVAALTISGPCVKQHWIFFNSMSVPGDPFCWHYWAIVLEEGSNNIHLVDMRHSCPTSITLGIQFDDATAVQVPGAPNTPLLSGSIDGPSDNKHYTFEPCSAVEYDVVGLELTTTPTYWIDQSPFTITGIIENNGRQTINSLEVEYGDGLNIFSATIDDLNIAPLQQYRIVHPAPWFPSPGLGQYDLTMHVTAINDTLDQVPSNDLMASSVKVISTAERSASLPLIEVFSSSTCMACATTNGQLDALLAQSQNVGKFNLVRYPECSPGMGDPYFTDEVEQRAQFYGIAVPPAYRVNGVIVYDSDISQALLDHWAAQPSMMDITVDAHLVGSSMIEMSVDVISNTTWTNSLVLHIAIVEQSTVNNVRTSGEGIFNQIMKKMVPSVQGTMLQPVNTGSVENINLTHTFQGNYVVPANASDPVDHAMEHSVEEFWDLRVVAWVQDNSTGRILQSATNTGAVSVDELQAQGQLGISPNPANELAIVLFKSNELRKNVTLTLLDLQGRILLQQLLPQMTANTYEALVDVSSFRSGLYRVVIRSENERISSVISVVH